MRRNTLKPYGGKDIVLNKKKGIFAHLFFSILIVVLCFFTLYAYRFDVMDFFYHGHYEDFELSKEKQEELADALLQFPCDRAYSPKIKETINQFEIAGTYQVLYSTTFNSIKDVNYYQVLEFATKDDYYIIHPESIDHGYRIPFVFQDGTLGSINITPNFSLFMTPYTVVILVVSLFLGGACFILFRYERKKRIFHRIIGSLSHLKFIKLFQSLSIKLVMINVSSLVCAVGLFFYMYINRYAFFEFLFDYHIGFQFDDSAVEVVREKMKDEKYSDIRFEIEYKEPITIEGIQYGSRMEYLLTSLKLHNMDVYLYDENGIYIAGTTRTSATVDFERGSLFDVEAVTSPVIQTYPIQTKDGFGSMWIFYYPLKPFVMPYIVVISILALLCYFIPVFSFTRKKANEIKYIYDGISVMANGDLHHEIYEDGYDEVALLGEHLNYMRRSLLETMEKEEQSMQANRELISAISHDLRTPLTSLNGYLEILQKGNYPHEEQMRYLRKCSEKTEQLKDRADRLFNYFAVFTDEEVHLKEMRFFDFMTLFTTMKEELEIHDFQVKMHIPEIDVMLMVDVKQMERVVDNIRSNLMKYASKAITIDVKLDTRLCIAIRNGYREKSEAESNHIGLKSIEKIIKAHDGHIEVRQEEMDFALILYLPIMKKDE